MYIVRYVEQFSALLLNLSMASQQHYLTVGRPLCKDMLLKNSLNKFIKENIHTNQHQGIAARQ